MIYHHILAAYDGSKPSDKALQQAVMIAGSKPGTRLTVAYVQYQPAFAVAGYGFVPPEGYQEKIQEYETVMLDQARNRIASLAYASVAVLRGNPAAAILEYAQGNNCDLIVMGSRGLGAIKEWMLGSVSHHVVQQARVPVLIVK
ncbi:universal stress protein [Cohnella silvisoli]|uniref:Universal stress protein n=1 Tax=Cohnella silvisoli TaxID=2873699 RepID=A0ABV1KMY3_9BACL|nr:universal stress protein [Cohnella silvisoli]MCD9020693.1 universal stress protein [Cohnella silvisoli]